ncbi:ATP-binding protein [Plantactinospora sp. WMMC1484]|uniref:ATP-binding protein n=1 Tax=Plantactinospora sp. WMMC1484 TaxID=3404122 RepID=UPI003BF52E5F
MSSISTERSWCLLVPQHAQGARTARHRLGAELDGTVPPALVADAEMVAAELLGNAVRHAEPLPGGMIRLTWLLRAGPSANSVEIRVTDGGASGPPRVRQAGPDATDGRGLHLVAALATEWGVERDGLGQSVWARLVHPVGQRLATVR